MSIGHVDDQSVYSDLFAVCLFSLIGLLLSVRALFEWGSIIEMTPLL